MTDILSIRGRVEALKFQYSRLTNVMEKTVLNNVINVYMELYTQYGVDVIYRIPDDKRNTKVLHGEKRTSEVNLILDYLVELKNNNFFIKH